MHFRNAGFQSVATVRRAFPLRTRNMEFVAGMLVGAGVLVIIGAISVELRDSCTHDWSAWSQQQYSSSIFGRPPVGVTLNERQCKKCGITQTRSLNV